MICQVVKVYTLITLQAACLVGENPPHVPQGLLCSRTLHHPAMDNRSTRLPASRSRRRNCLGLFRWFVLFVCVFLFRPLSSSLEACSRQLLLWWPWLVSPTRWTPCRCQCIWPRGPMDKASAYGAGDCRFESCRGHAHATTPGHATHLLQSTTLWDARRQQRLNERQQSQTYTEEKTTKEMTNEVGEGATTDTRQK